METSCCIVDTLNALIQFTQPFPTRYILGTFQMLLCHLPNMLSPIIFKMVVKNVPKIFPAYVHVTAHNEGERQSCIDGINTTIYYQKNSHNHMIG